MADDTIILDRFSGASTFASKEDRQIDVLQEIVNLRPHVKPGRAIKRSPYTDKITSGLTSLQSMIEFQNKGDQQILFLVDTNTFKESIATGSSYSAPALLTADERTAGSTVDGNSFFPQIINNEIRAGAGNSVSTERPVWFGFLHSRNRFSNNVTISSGRYLDEQNYIDKLEELCDSASFTELRNDVVGTGFSLPSNFIVCFSAVVDEYQKIFPDDVIAAAKYIETSAYTESALMGTITVLDSDKTKSKRITAIDVFIAKKDSSQFLDFDPTIDNFKFLTRIDMNKDGEPFFKTSGTIDTGAPKITINNYANWLTFHHAGFWIKDTTNSKNYKISSYAVNGANIEISVDTGAGDSLTNAGAADLEFYSKWWNNSGTWTYDFLYDEKYFGLGQEMYDYLGIPKNDPGFQVADFQYKYVAANSQTAFYSGFKDDKRNFSFYSVPEAFDVVPVLNVVRHNFEPKGNISVGRDFFVFGSDRTERIQIAGNSNSFQDDSYLEAGITSHKAVSKISDDEVVFLSYKGIYIISARTPHFVGEHLNDWWSTKLSRSQMEACVSSFDHDHNEVWFSFPTYTDSSFVNGLIIVFDVEAWRRNEKSPFWFVKTDTAIKSFSLNHQNKLFAGSTTKIIDFDTPGTDESLETSYRLKMLKSPVPGKKVRWNQIFVDVETSDSLTTNLFFDGSASATSLSLNADKKGFIRNLKKTLEIEIKTASSQQSVEHLGLLLTFSARRVS